MGFNLTDDERYLAPSDAIAVFELYGSVGNAFYSDILSNVNDFSEYRPTYTWQICKSENKTNLTRTCAHAIWTSPISGAFCDSFQV